MNILIINSNTFAERVGVRSFGRVTIYLTMPKIMAKNNCRLLLIQELTSKCILETVCTRFCICFRPPTKLREGNVFTGVCHSVHGMGLGRISLVTCSFRVVGCRVSQVLCPFWGGVSGASHVDELTFVFKKHYTSSSVLRFASSILPCVYSRYVNLYEN